MKLKTEILQKIKKSSKLKTAIAKKLKVTERSIERIIYGNPERGLKPNEDNSDFTKTSVVRLIAKELKVDTKEILTDK